MASNWPAAQDNDTTLGRYISTDAVVPNCFNNYTDAIEAMQATLQPVLGAPSGSAGQVLAINDPVTPSFSWVDAGGGGVGGAVLSRSTPQSLPLGVPTACAFDGVSSGGEAFWSSANPGHVLIPAAGYYLLSWNFDVYPVGDATFAYLQVKANGAVSILLLEVPVLGGEMAPSGTAVFYLASSGYVEVLVNCEGSGADATLRVFEGSPVATIVALS